MREAYVLAAFSDRERELIVRDDHLHPMLVLVDNHLGNLGGSERTAYEFGLVVGPRHDIDLFAAQFLHHRLHARPLHPDPSSDPGVVAVLRVNRTLVASTPHSRLL